MSKLILHAGHHKTGTSAIQNYLFQNSPCSGVQYLHAGEPNSSLAMLLAFRDNLEQLPAFRGIQHRREAQAHSLAALECAVHSLTPGIHLLSAESTSMFRPNELRNLVKFMRQFYDEIEVHQYVRSPKSRMESAFQQKLKTRFTDLNEEFLLDYRQITKRFDDVFGRENVYLHKYHRDEFPEGNVILHFCRRLGMQQLTASDLKTFEVNNGLSREATAMLYAYRCHYPTQDAHDQQRVELLSQIRGTPLRFHSTLFKKLLREREGSINWFEERAGFSFKDDSDKSDQDAVKCNEDLICLATQSAELLLPNQAIVRDKEVKPAYPCSSYVAERVRSLANRPD